MRYILLILCIHMPVLAYAIAPDSLWSRTFGGSLTEECYSGQQTSDGGYVLAGWTTSFGAGDADFWLVKVNEDGDSVWSRTFGGSDIEWCWSVRQTFDGGYVMAGKTASFGAGWDDIWLVKTDENGDSLWSRTYGGVSWDRCTSVKQTSDSGFILAGSTCSFSCVERISDFWLVKTDANGDSLWSRTFGGIKSEEGRCVVQTSDGGYILAGHTHSFGMGKYDFWLVKTDEHGNSLWSRTFGGKSDDKCRSVQQTSDGGYILAGKTYSFELDTGDFWLVKTDENGDSLWSRTFGGSAYESCRSVQQTSDGGYILAGWAESFGAGNSDMWLVKTDENGDSLWSRAFGGNFNDGAYFVEQMSDGGYVLAGLTESFGTGIDYWLVKTEPERPYYTTVYPNNQGTNPVVLWIAPQTCDYKIYCTTNMAEIGEPPGADWSIAVILTNVQAGKAEWKDPTGFVSYKRYAVTMSCP